MGGAFRRDREAGGEGANHWYHVVLKEGATACDGCNRNHKGVAVSPLDPSTFRPVTLRRGPVSRHWDRLDEERMAELLQAVGYAPRPAPKPEPRRPRFPGRFTGSAARWKARHPVPRRPPKPGRSTGDASGHPHRVVMPILGLESLTGDAFAVWTQ